MDYLEVCPGIIEKITCLFCFEESSRWFSVHIDADRLFEVIVMEHSEIDGDGDDLCLLD